MSKLILEAYELSKTYQDGTLKVDVLKDLNINIHENESVAIVGASGSGKSTLLHLLGGLDKPTSGNIKLMGQDIGLLSQNKLSQLRNQYLGFVYQFHHLLPEFSALENVMMPLLIRKMDKGQAKEEAINMLGKVGLAQRIEHRPSELSGGERQRAAIARALVTQPACVLADEPTGNLDRKNAEKIIELMLDLKEEHKASLIVVTHDDQLAKRFERRMAMDEGQL
ncbi:lipoprotein-releasing ABC transporter ATP-binding protein LolD [Neisseria sp. Ec49-e6-T10]|uniref:lipoprotein-releasing ABC transporter ATP-binding protein LolD n=1 Tax=Neisseria sp. Ec49-e6-T10 TaxID=3140744 RepID=UPI003EBDE178